MNQAHHRNGIFITALAPLAWSLSGLFTRAISADLMSMLFWRGLFSGTTVFIAFFLIERGRIWEQLKRLRWPALGVAIFSSMSMITGIGSLRFSTVADTMVIYATVPFITAAIAYVVIGEKPSRSTLFAAALALGGVVVTLGGQGLGGGAWFGKLLAVFMTLGMAGVSVLMRKYQGVPMLPAMGASAFLTSLFSFWFVKSFNVSTHDIVLIGLFGIIQNAAGLILYTLGSRRIPAAEATLIAALEVPFTPLWVWMLIGETPPATTLIGGAVVLLALFGHIFGELRGVTKAEPEGFETGV